ncbi:MAG: ubiquitin-like domain-containing protein [Chloroflexota bacterium]
MSTAPSDSMGDATGQFHEPTAWLTQPRQRIALLVLTFSFLCVFAVTFILSRKNITIVDGPRQVTVQTHSTTVQSVLREAQVKLDPADRVLPGLQYALAEGLVVVVERARPVSLAADGEVLDLRTQASTVGELLAQAGLRLGPDDVVLVHGAPVDPGAMLSSLVSPVRVASTENALLARAVPTSRSSRSEEDSHLLAAELVVKRAVPVTVHDAGLPVTIDTTADTVGEALREAGINLYLADLVHPDPQQPVLPYMHVYIERSKAVTIASDDIEIAPQGKFVTRTRRATLGEVIKDEGIKLNGREVIVPPLESPVAHEGDLFIRRYHPFTVEVDGTVVTGQTKKATVREALADAKIALGPMDRVEPAPDAEPRDDMIVTITRVKEVTEEEDESLPFESLVQPNAEIELDQSDYQEGEMGVFRRQYLVVYENGLPVQKTLVKEWVEKAPVHEISYYGTKIVWRDLETPNGTVKYWRKLTVLATYYHNSTCGKSPSDPSYGVTRVGTATRKGVVAVDPNVIPLWTNMYVPGYGTASAQDTGGGIKGKHIDLYMPEGDNSWGVRYVTIYLTGPLPNWYPARLP